jgi:hypothetical protein
MAVFGGDSVFRSGAPRSMKVGTIRSPFRYDAAARHALQLANLRQPAILRYASWADGHAEQSRDWRDGTRDNVATALVSPLPDVGV